MPAIVLATMNARYIHSAMGLRCLAASLGSLDHALVEYSLQQAAGPSVGWHAPSEPVGLSALASGSPVASAHEVLGWLRQCGGGGGGVPVGMTMRVASRT